ncbi:NAD-dependent epimerase/dehydratase family protein [Tepidibacter mesophilus]|uniref:NAD-dependent epimerase/dehydratase family protein n=1 Tax=Tepidibacter mesophilus TaxID=655607 RepID=UPI000C08B5C5|nr:NAD-dependent epimerase/dehydratase family protein [Tepidibacter mesophilus]
MKALVTGCAGFIGSTLSERLLDEGFEVIGIDSFTDYYSKDIKEFNLKNLILNDKFTLVSENLVICDLKKYLDVDYVFHQAGQPGVRGSWGYDFEEYIYNNISATQKLLEESKEFDIKKIVYASSSSVYGNINTVPMKETQITKPYSPYGVTKLAAENLCDLYSKNYGLPVISLRYFTVYGPRQRPEMAISTFIKNILNDKPICIYGDGNQGRDFTYVDDIVDANIKAAYSDIKSDIFNVGSQSPIKLIDLVKIIEKLIDKKANINYLDFEKGDVKDTYSDISKIRKFLGYKCEFDIEKGIHEQIKYIKNFYLL